MESIPEKIRSFLEEEYILSFSCRQQETLHSVTVFYIYCPERTSFFFASGSGTSHGETLKEYPNTAGTIYRTTRFISEIQGVQFTGRAFPVSGTDEQESCLLKYRQAFPEASAMQAEFWEIFIDYIKFTDNTESFGRKTIWTRPL